MRADELQWEPESDDSPKELGKVDEGDYIVYKDEYGEQKMSRVILRIEPRYKMFNGDWVSHAMVMRPCKTSEIPKPII